MDSKTAARVLRLPATMQMVGLGRDAIYRGAREGWFPKPLKISERASGWLESELEQFIASRAAARKQPGHV
jgi:prophage regulatory protein